MISIISSTNRPDSKTIQIARYYKALLDAKGIDSQIIDLAGLPTDFIHTALYHNRGKNELFNEFVSMVNQSKKFVFVVPEYNGSFPGVLKAFIDGQDFPGGFKHKKCALLSLSSGVMGGSLALSHLTDIFNYVGMHVLANKPRLARVEAIFQNGKITDRFLAELIEKQVEELIEF